LIRTSGWQSRLVVVLFLIPAVINLLPLSGVLGAGQLQTLYGMSLAGADLLLLLQHRAVVIGVVGLLLLAAAIRPALRPAASVAGLLSMGSYLFLALPLGEHNTELQRVFWADVIALVSLLLAVSLSRVRHA